jgi:hypothetical protein
MSHSSWLNVYFNDNYEFYVRNFPLGVTFTETTKKAFRSLSKVGWASTFFLNLLFY